MTAVHDPYYYARPPWPWERPRTTVPPHTLRVSDAERAEVTALLCRHFADGRLDETEFNDRQARASAAKTRADLSPLLADLPRLDPPVPDRPERPHRFPGWIVVMAAVVLIGWTVTAAAASVTRPHLGWLVLLVVAAVVVTRGSWHRHRH